MIVSDRRVSERFSYSYSIIMPGGSLSGRILVWGNLAQQGIFPGEIKKLLLLSANQNSI